MSEEDPAAGVEAAILPEGWRAEVPTPKYLLSNLKVGHRTFMPIEYLFIDSEHRLYVYKHTPVNAGLRHDAAGRRKNPDGFPLAIERTPEGYLVFLSAFLGDDKFEREPSPAVVIESCVPVHRIA